MSILKPKKLSLSEEREILLQAIKKDEFLDNGSSRAVFALNDEYVVKIALDEGGFLQNDLEIKMYEMDTINKYLARIESYGKFIIVMERVSPIDEVFYPEEEDYFLENDEFDEEAYDKDVDLFDKTREVIYELQDYLGSTTDNEQLGFTAEGDIVSFDYGFMAYPYEAENTEATDYTDFIGDIEDFLAKFKYNNEEFLKHVYDLCGEKL